VTAALTVPRSRDALLAWAAPLVGAGIAGALWIVGGRAGWARGMIVTPAEAVEPIVGTTRSLYWRATSATVWSAARGLLIGGSLAFFAALAAVTVPSLRRAISRLAAIANAAPWVAVAPCLLVVLGRDRGPTAVAALAVFFYVFVGATVGLASAARSSHDVLTALGAPRWFRVRALQLPGCWPALLDGLKLAARSSPSPPTCTGRWRPTSSGWSTTSTRTSRSSTSSAASGWATSRAASSPHPKGPGSA
jgi:ABC-type nitrate/sulfonate/bicarbonate transport system permease component